MKKGAFNHKPEAQFRARELRAGMSISEKVLWEILRKNRLGFSFRRQFRIDRFFLDFYCTSAKLCIEADGEQHEAEYDGYRDEVLRKLGIETLRIPSLDLFDADKLDHWIRKISQICEERTHRFSLKSAGSISHPQPPPSLTNQSEGWGSEGVRR